MGEHDVTLFKFYLVSLLHVTDRYFIMLNTKYSLLCA